MILIQLNKYFVSYFHANLLIKDIFNHYFRDITDIITDDISIYHLYEQTFRPLQKLKHLLSKKYILKKAIFLHQINLAGL